MLSPLVALLLAAPAAAVPAAPKMDLKVPIEQPRRTELCFPSGLKVVGVARPGTGIAAVASVIGGGRSVEPPGLRGSAHLLEHVWFRSRPRGGPPIWDRHSGLEVDGVTTQDATVYVTVGAAPDLGELLALEAARLLDPFEGVDEDVVNAEKEIVASELLWRGEHSVRAAARELEHRLYPANHPYREATATVEDVSGRTLEDLKAYHASIYKPRNTTVHVEADVESSVLKDLVVAAFPDELRLGGAGDCTHPVAGEPPPKPVDDEIGVVRGPVWHSEVWVSWSTPPGFWADDVLARLAASNLENIVWARLPYVRGLRGDAQADLGCTYTPGVWASDVSCRVQLPYGTDASAVLKGIRSSLAKQWTPHETEYRVDLLSELKPLMITGALRQADRLDTAALRTRALWSHYGEGPDPLQPVLRGAMGIDEPAVSAFAKKWLTPERMVAVVVEPAAPEQAAGQARSGEARLEAPAVTPWKTVAPDLSSVTERELANGLRLWSSPLANAPVAYSSLTFRGGSTHAPAGVQEVFENLAVYPLSVSLWEVRRRNGTRTSTWYDTDAVYSWSAGSVGNLDAQLWLLRAKLDVATMDFSARQSVLDDRVRNMAEYFVGWPWTTSQALRLGHLLPDSRASLPWWEDVRAARYVSQGDVVRWQKSVMHPANGTAVVTGVTDDGEGWADKYLGKWKAPKKPPRVPSAPRVPELAERKVFALPIPAVLANVILTCRVPSRSSGDDAALDVLEGVFDRGMRQTLREDGRAYAPVASISTIHDGLGLLTLRVDVPPAEAGPTLRSMFDLVETVADGAPEAVVAWEKQAALGRFGRRTASALALSGLLEEAAARSLTLDDVRDYPARVAAVDAGALSAMLADCRGYEAVTVIGPDPEGLDAAGVPFEVDDWQGRGREIVESLK